MSSSTFPRKNRRKGILPYLLLTIPPLCWAGNIVLARGINEIIPPVSFAFWRWTVAFLILLLFHFSQAVRDWKAVVSHWRIMVFLSATGITCFNTLLYMAVHTTTAINGALIQTTMPAVIVLLSLLVFREKITKIQVVGVVLCMFGACMVVLRGSLSRLVDLSLVQGDVLMLVAVVLYALYSVFLRRRPNMHPISFLIYTFGMGALGLLPLYIWEISAVGTFPVNRDTLLSILYVAVFPSMVAYFCWNRGIELIGANRGGLFINLIPVFASLMAIVWLGETLKAYHLAGMVMILVGMVLFNRIKK